LTTSRIPLPASSFPEPPGRDHVGYGTPGSMRNTRHTARRRLHGRHVRQASAMDGRPTAGGKGGYTVLLAGLLVSGSLLSSSTDKYLLYLDAVGLSEQPMVRLLLERKATLAMRDDHGSSPSSAAACNPAGQGDEIKQIPAEYGTGPGIHDSKEAPRYECNRVSADSKD